MTSSDVDGLNVFILFLDGKIQSPQWILVYPLKLPSGDPSARAHSHGMMIASLIHAWCGPPALHAATAVNVPWRQPRRTRTPPEPRMALSDGDAFPPKVLKECCSAQARQAGKRALLFFYEDDETCADELAALDEVGGELFLRGCELLAVRGGGGATAAAPSRYPFVSFFEDSGDRLRGALGPATDEPRASYLVDATGTVVCRCCGATGHADAAMGPASWLDKAPGMAAYDACLRWPQQAVASHGFPARPGRRLLTSSAPPRPPTAWAAQAPRPPRPLRRKRRRRRRAPPPRTKDGAVQPLSESPQEMTHR